MKKNKLHFLFRLLLFWFSFYLIARTSLLLVMKTMPGIGNLDGFETSFFYGLRTDLSAISYLMALPTLLFIIVSLTTGKIWIKLLNAVNLFLIFTCILLILANLGLYKGWGTLLNARAVSFMKDPQGIIASLSNGQIMGIFGLVIILFFLSGIIYFRFTAAEISRKSKQDAVAGFIALAILPVGMRGGFQEIPINESAAYFSHKMPLNHLAANPAWNLFNSLNKSGLHNKNPYQYFDEVSAQRLASDFICHEPDTTILLKNHRPNIVLIVLESWSADIIGTLSNDSATTPYFNSLCNTGYLFRKIYASGRRTDQMLPSILSGYPSIPHHSITRFNEKISKLPMLPAQLKQAGYTSYFVYGGELGFANMHSFLLQAGFQSIIGKSEFSNDIMNSKWGAHDQYIFEKANEQMHEASQPFFQMILTLSTHEPFEVPDMPAEKHHSEAQKFRNAARYTDRCLSSYFSKVSTQPWFNNTLFILVSDHGHHLPGGRNYYDPSGYRIPLLLTGPALQKDFIGKKNDGIGGQHEIPNTILRQLQIDDSKFPFGATLIRSCGNSSAYLNYDDGFGIVSGNKQFVYLFGEDQYVNPYSSPHISSDSAFTNTGKAFLQNLFQRFKDL